MSERRAIEDRFPKVNDTNSAITSPATDAYNCVAWVARDIEQWWHPGDVHGYYWPRQEIGDGDRLEDYVRLFEYLGFERCADGVLTEGKEKIAVYGSGDDFDHVALQREGGSWSSKLGELPDIRHDELDSLSGPGFFEYSPVVIFLQRDRQPHPLAERGLLLPSDADL